MSGAARGARLPAGTDLALLVGEWKPQLEVDRVVLARAALWQESVGNAPTTVLHVLHEHSVTCSRCRCAQLRLT